MNLRRSRQSCHIVAVFVLALTAGAGPGVGVPGSANGRAFTGALQGYDLGSANPVQFRLGRPMNEISGLAVDARGRLFAHNDERAIVSLLDPATGETLKSFRAGRNGVRADFEGITFAGSRLFLISSNGDMLEFGEGDDDESVEYVVTDVRSRDLCREVEGLEYDATQNALLLACKVTKARSLRDRMVVLRYSLRTRKLDADPAYSIALEFLEHADLPAEISPSGLAIHPLANTLFLLAARENLVIELDRSGAVLGVARLKRSSHRQAEGIAFAKDGTMYIADEGGSGRATLTVYAYSGIVRPIEPAGWTRQ